MRKTYIFRTNDEVRAGMTRYERKMFTTEEHELTVVDEDGEGYRMGISTEQVLELMEQIRSSGLRL